MPYVKLPKVVTVDEGGRNLNATVAEAERIAKAIRETVIVQSKRANVGHIGSALSVCELLAALYAGPLANVDPDDPDRDRFVMSKGHAALGLYAALHARGGLSDEQLGSFGTDGTVVAGHPERALRGIDFSTGSLGQGLSVAAGAALAARLAGSSRRVYALLSDAECNEGSVWEAAMFAAHHRLGNLTILIDVNGQQALGYTQDVLSLEPLAERWQSFGWTVEDLNGHDLDALTKALASPRPKPHAAPRVLLARTTFGKGVSFMESRIEWHYLPMSEAEYASATAELETASR
jgi:transketolase